MDIPILRRQFFNRATVREDFSAGLVLGIQSIPDGLTSGLLALVNPVYGLYSYMTGVFTGIWEWGETDWQDTHPEQNWLGERESPSSR